MKKKGFEILGAIEIFGGGDGMNKRASVTIESLGLDYSTAINRTCTPAAWREATVGKAWNRGRSVCEIARLMSLSPVMVQTILDGLRRTDPDLLRGEDEPGFTAVKKKEDEPVGEEWNGKLADYLYLLKTSGGGD